MIVTLNCTAPVSIALEDPDTFTAFHVVAVGTPSAEVLSAALQSVGVGYAAGSDQAHITTAAVVKLAAPASDGPNWQRRFDGMLTYATAKGWYDADTNAIAAHVEWQAT